MSKPNVLIDFDHTLFDTDKLKKDFGSYDDIVDFVAHTKDSLDTYLYPDSLSFLKAISENFTPVLFTEADVEYQKNKVSKTSAAQFFSPENSFYFPPNEKNDQLPFLIEKKNPICLIDDKPEMIAQAQKLNLPGIRIKRGKYSQEDNQTIPAFEISSLDEITSKSLLKKIADPLSSKKIHMVGIKGVGMTAVALMLDDLGKDISGSDTSDSQITDAALSERQISVSEFDSALIAQDIDLVIYSGAYKRDKHPELLKATELGIHTISQAQALAYLMKNKDLIAVCGVGGKTTTSALIATVYDELEQNPSWFVGVSHINGTKPPGKLGTGPFFIAEADEYAIAPPENNLPKFSLYDPKVIICTNLVHDHPDIYPTYQDTVETFVEFFNRLPEDGLLLLNHQTEDVKEIVQKLTTKAIVQTFGFDSQADWILEKTSDGYLAHFENQKFQLNPFIPGDMNAINALTGLAASHFLGINAQDYAQALPVFKGTKRRMERIGDKDGVLYMDDYAHHPHEIKAALKAVKQAYPNRRIITVFHPHTYSRTKTLFTEFSESFADTDLLLVAPIFSSAREKKDPTVSSQLLALEIGKHHSAVKYVDSFENIIKDLISIRQEDDLILTLGAGDIYKIHTQLLAD